MTFSGTATLEDLRAQVARFAEERDWRQFHTTRNVLLAMISEVGEVAELVRWDGDAVPSPAADKAQVWGDELADVLILLLRLADVSGCDLGEAFTRKLAAAGKKYPVDRFKGSSRKYDEPAGG